MAGTAGVGRASGSLRRKRRPSQPWTFEHLPYSDSDDEDFERPPKKRLAVPGPATVPPASEAAETVSAAPSAPPAPETWDEMLTPAPLNNGARGAEAFIRSLPVVPLARAAELGSRRHGKASERWQRLARDSVLQHCEDNGLQLHRLTDPENAEEYFICYPQATLNHQGSNAKILCALHYRELTQAPMRSMLAGAKLAGNGKVQTWTRDDCVDKLLKMTSLKAGYEMDPNFLRMVAVADVWPFSVSSQSTRGTPFTTSLILQWYPELRPYLSQHLQEVIASCPALKIAVTAGGEPGSFLDGLALQGPAFERCSVPHPVGWKGSRQYGMASRKTIRRGDASMNKLREAIGGANGDEYQHALENYYDRGNKAGPLALKEMQGCPSEVRSAMASRGAQGPFTKKGKQTIESWQQVMKTGRADPSLDPKKGEKFLGHRELLTTGKMPGSLASDDPGAMRMLQWKNLVQEGTEPAGSDFDHESVSSFLQARETVATGEVPAGAANKENPAELAHMQTLLKTKEVQGGAKTDPAKQKKMLDRQRAQRDGVPCVVHETNTGRYAVSVTATCLAWANMLQLHEVFHPGEPYKPLYVFKGTNKEAEAEAEEFHRLLQSARAAGGQGTPAGRVVRDRVLKALRPDTKSGYHGVRPDGDQWRARFTEGGKDRTKTFWNAKAAAAWREDNMPTFTGKDTKQRKGRNASNAPWL